MKLTGSLILKILSFCTIGALIIYAVMLIVGRKTGSVVQITPQNKTEAVAEMSIQQFSDNVNEDFVSVEIFVDSYGKKSSGIDTVIEYDAEVLRYVDSENYFPKLKMYPVPQDSTLRIGLLKDLSDSTSYVFNNQPVMKVNFKVLKKVDSTSLALQFKKGETADSNLMVDSDSELADILAKTRNLTINFGSMLNLTYKKLTRIPGTPYTAVAEYHSDEVTTNPETVCNDCMVSIELNLMKDNAKVGSALFSEGGIDGLVAEPQEINGLIFSLKKHDTKSAVFEFTSK